MRHDANKIFQIIKAVAAMMFWFYHFKYDSKSLDEGLSPVILDIRTFVIADKYFIAPLRENAFTGILKCLNLGWDKDTLPEAIDEIYSLEPTHKDMLKSAVTSILLAHPELLRDRQKYAKFHEVFDKPSGFSQDVAIAYATTLS